MDDDLILVAKINGAEVGFTDDAHFYTDSTKIVKQMNEVLGTIVELPEPTEAGLTGWGIIVLCALLDPDFEIIDKIDDINSDDIEAIRTIVKNQ